MFCPTTFWPCSSSCFFFKIFCSHMFFIWLGEMMGLASTPGLLAIDLLLWLMSDKHISKIANKTKTALELGHIWFRSWIKDTFWMGPALGLRGGCSGILIDERN